jgi:hypothetical protein
MILALLWRFQYGGDGLFLVACGSYVVNRWLVKPWCGAPLVQNWFNNFSVERVRVAAVIVGVALAQVALVCSSARLSDVGQARVSVPHVIHAAFPPFARGLPGSTTSFLNTNRTRFPTPKYRP